MNLSTKRDTRSQVSKADKMYISLFPTNGLLKTTEQIRRFELLRLAFFVLKLRKLEQHLAYTCMQGESTAEQGHEQEFQRSLLRHAIFQQVLTLFKLDARDQALQIIEACQN
ncbi:MAG: hypothetical protein ACJ788_18585 [Ktedonobacteraceae bacterium]|jgi:hypothetical protein